MDTPSARAPTRQCVPPATAAEPMERRLLFSGTTAAFSPVADGDFNGDGAAETLVRVSAGRVRLANLGYTGGAYRRGSLLLLDSGGALFGDPLGIRARGNSAPLAAVADFNSDGRLDLVLAGRRLAGAAGGLTFLPGNGDGTFAAGTTIGGAPSNITSLEAGDVNNDGRADLVGTSLVRNLRNRGTGANRVVPVALDGNDGAGDADGSLAVVVDTSDRGARRPHLVGVSAEAGGGVINNSTLLPSGTGAGFAFGFGDSLFGDEGFDASLAPGFTPPASRVGVGAEAGGARLGGFADTFFDGGSFDDTTDQVFVLLGNGAGGFTNSIDAAAGGSTVE